MDTHADIIIIITVAVLQAEGIMVEETVEETAEDGAEVMEVVDVEVEGMVEEEAVGAVR